MRDPKRIHAIMEAVESVWNKYPDMRFFQIYMLLKSQMYSNNLGKDIYYGEDSEVLRAALQILNGE